MSHFSDIPNDVRVDFFKVTGKWKYTERMFWPASLWSKEILIHEAYANALYHHLKKPEGGHRMDGLVAVCLSPYHEISHPLMMNVTDAIHTAIRRPLSDDPTGK